MLRLNYDRCEMLMTDALAIDSLFAAAYWHRGVCNLYSQDLEKMFTDFRRAYQLRERMTDWGRAEIVASYYTHVKGEHEKAIEV